MKNLKIIECEQNSPEWFAAKLGKFSGSDISNLIYESGFYKTGEKKGQEKPIPKDFLNLVKEKKAEKKHGISQHEIDTKVGRCIYNNFEPSIGLNGKYGQLMQSDALEYYSKKYDEDVYTVGLVLSNKYPEDLCVSPDALSILKSFGVETKCPVTLRIHEDHFNMKTPLDLKEINDKYYWQVLACILVCEADSWEFVSYFPFISAEFVMSCLVIKRDEVKADLEHLDNCIKKAIELKNE